MTDRDAWVRFACAGLSLGRTPTESARVADAMMGLAKERKFDEQGATMPQETLKDRTVRLLGEL